MFQGCTVSLDSSHEIEDDPVPGATKNLSQSLNDELIFIDCFYQVQ